MKYMLDDMDCESLYLYSTEELHPNSQGCIGKKATQISLTLQVLKQQEGFIQWKFSTYELLITFIEKQPSVELVTY